MARKDERLRVVVEFSDPVNQGSASVVSSIAFGMEEAQATRQKMITELKAQGIKPFNSWVEADEPNASAPHRKPRPSAVS